MTFRKQDTGYWERKLVAYLHDPIDKAFRIQGHEDRASSLLEKLGLQTPNKAFWCKADGIASGFERGQVPSYSRDENENGAVDFVQKPLLTHPVASCDPLQINWPEQYKNRSAADISSSVHNALVEVMENDVGMKPGDGGYSDKFAGDPDQFAVARFLYVHLALRFKLSRDNVADLGGLWHRLPADSRFPDHTIWQHNALTSALYSCMEMSGDPEQVGMMAFSITPVQSFISSARKLRDFWTSSVLLSWLAFEGIRWVIEHLGPDHVLYPSLIDQPLVRRYLEDQWHVDFEMPGPGNDLATLPNKFTFLIPFKDASEIGQAIEQHVMEAWRNLSTIARNELFKIMGIESETEKDVVSSLFERQAGHFWEFHWSAGQLLRKEDHEVFTDLLPNSTWEANFETGKLFNQILSDKKGFKDSLVGMMYGTSHAMVQTALAATKLSRQGTRHSEPGEKCHLCGEFEVLHAEAFESGMSAAEYKNNISDFWGELRDKWNRDPDFKTDGTERLCSICFIKRALYRCFQGQSNKAHILHRTFNGKEGFPSTTQMALHDFYVRHKIGGIDTQQKLAQALHESDEETGKLDGKSLENADKYYALLLMDGDHMGKLVNGETLSSKWDSVMHPDIVSRLKSSEFDATYRINWGKVFDSYPRRILTPSVHASISEALGDFALYGVNKIIQKHQGVLVYAGGDDVCAVLPVRYAYAAAREIRDYYHGFFRVVNRDGSKKLEESKWLPEPGKLSVGLGTGKEISISAAILICHHKENMGAMVDRAHHLLDEKSKAEMDRNACVIELKKRSGGSRFFGAKWDDPSWKGFDRINQALRDTGDKQQELSTSLVYRLEKLRNGVEAIIHSNREDRRSLLVKLLDAELKRSGISGEKGIADSLADVVWAKRSGMEDKFEPERAIVCAFLSSGEEQS